LTERSPFVKCSCFITYDQVENLRLAASRAVVPFEDVVKHVDMDEKMESLYVK
jgi:hypothetical protein